MYSLDVNFLKDRHLETTKTTTSPKKSPTATLKQQTPLLIGAGVGLGLVALTGGFLAFLNLQKNQTQDNIAELDAKLGQLQEQAKSVEEIKQQIEVANGEVTALVSVFNQIRPWSALLEELKVQIPENVQISSVIEGPAPQVEGQPPGTQLTIDGYAQNYEAVNDFLLTLQNSRFLKANRTQIVSATLEKSLPLQLTAGSPYQSASLPDVVKYKITTEFSNIPADQLRKELSQRGAVGLLSRLRTLEQTGAIK